MGSIWSNNISLSIFGQSHGVAIGMTLDGIPAGEVVDMEALQRFLQRRAPGRTPWATPRQEKDMPEFLSGIVDGITCGAPITAIIRNENIRSLDYSDIRDIPRPGHADFTAHVKHGGFQDVAGGGHFSGRLTAALCIAGGICLQIITRRGISIGAHIASIGGILDMRFDAAKVTDAELSALSEMDFPVMDPFVIPLMTDEILRAKNEGDSLGGIIECAVVGLPPGLGEPIFDGMENRIAQIIFAIPAVKGVEFGAGFDAAAMRGSEHNDPFFIDDNAVIKTVTNHHGGILGGITSGMPLIFRTAIKPTPSIGKIQSSVSLSRKESAELTVRGRHDPCIVPRAVPCVEAAVAIAIMDLMANKNRSDSHGFETVTGKN